MQGKTGLGIRKGKREREEIGEHKRGPKVKRRRRYKEQEEEERTTDASAALKSCDKVQELASFSPGENDATSGILSHDSQSCASCKSCRLAVLSHILPARLRLSPPLAQAVSQGLRSFSHPTNSPALCRSSLPRHAPAAPRYFSSPTTAASTVTTVAPRIPRPSCPASYARRRSELPRRNTAPIATATVL